MKSSRTRIPATTTTWALLCSSSLLLLVLFEHVSSFQQSHSFAGLRLQQRSTSTTGSLSQIIIPRQQRFAISVQSHKNNDPPLNGSVETQSTSAAALVEQDASSNNKTNTAGLSPEEIRLLVGEDINSLTTTTARTTTKPTAGTAKSLLSSSEPYWCYWSTAYELAQAGGLGVLTGFFVAMFKLSIEAVRDLCYEQDILATYPILLAVIPAFGGAMVGLLLLLGGPMPPGLRGTVQDVDQSTTNALQVQMQQQQQQNTTSASSLPFQLEIDQQQINIQGNFLRKSLAAIVTLGTGCSLGPEGPCVEIGMNMARASMAFNKKQPERDLLLENSNNDNDNDYNMNGSAPSPSDQRRGWNRILLSCGAAAGVAAGFNAPIAGVFFALEIMQNAFAATDLSYQEKQQQQQQQQEGDSTSTTATTTTPTLWTSMTTTTTITPILISSVLSALIAQTFLGNSLILVVSQYTLKTPLIELPLYLLLGALSGVTAFVFSYSAKVSQQFFDGDFGTQAIRNTMKAIPTPIKPIIGGLLCGVVGLAFPQILFFGYETLNSLLKNNSLPLTLILSLLGVKTIMTAISAGSGLVGGTFAPSLFLGAMLGAGFHDIAAQVLQALHDFDYFVSSGGHVYLDDYTLGLSSKLYSNVQTISVPQLQLAGTPAYAMVGAASVLAALFRAPLTASLLLFEVTRDYDIILPLMASAGIGSIVSDILEDTLERQDQMRRRDMDPVSWGDLADDEEKSLKRFAPVTIEVDGDGKLLVADMDGDASAMIAGDSEIRNE